MIPGFGFRDFIASSLPILTPMAVFLGILVIGLIYELKKELSSGRGNPTVELRCDRGELQCGLIGLLRRIELLI